LSRSVRFPRKVIITLLITGTITVAVPVTIKTYNSHIYNNYLFLGQKYLSDGNYEEAVINFDNALKYKSSEYQEVNKLIERAAMLKQSRDAFDRGAQFVYEKKYLDAIDSFEKVPASDDLRYEITQKKIEECKRVFSDTNLSAAQNEAAKGKYEAGLSYIEAILKVDPLNQTAMALKNQYSSIITARAAEHQKKTIEQMEKLASKINLTTSMNNNE
jgi:tetratricopeptide (TPR) repeat protein